MRKFVIAAALLLAGGLLSGSPAQAAVGCLCATWNKAPVCTDTPFSCTGKMAGACVAPCDYTAPKMSKMSKKVSKKKKKM
jgi:hypothetical protein